MIGYIDIDLPVGEPFSREPHVRPFLAPPARALIQAVDKLLGGSKSHAPRSAADSSPR